VYGQSRVLDPAVQNAAKENGAVAQEKLDELEKGTAEARAAARAQAAQAQAATAKNLQDMTAMMDRMIVILPQIMRGQHVMELAYGKQCTWIMGAIPPGANPFGQVPGR
jgi:hypothetical protein